MIYCFLHGEKGSQRVNSAVRNVDLVREPEISFVPYNSRTIPWHSLIEKLKKYVQFPVCTLVYTYKPCKGIGREIDFPTTSFQQTFTEYMYIRLVEKRAILASLA